MTNGQLYTMAIEAMNQAGYGLPSVDSAVVNIVPGRFASAFMNFTSITAGSQGNMELYFQTANRVPGNGVVMATLPEGMPGIAGEGGHYENLLTEVCVVSS